MQQNSEEILTIENFAGLKTLLYLYYYHHLVTINIHLDAKAPGAPNA